MLLSSPVLAQQQQGSGYGPDMWNDGWNGWFLGPFMMIFVFAVLVVAVVPLARWLIRAGHNHSKKTPADILKERFARGEIDEEEFEERKRVVSE